MVKQTVNYKGYALPATPEGQPVGWRTRLDYLWKVLNGRIRIVGPVDVSHVKTDGYMEGRIRVTLSEREQRNYKIEE